MNAAGLKVMLTGVFARLDMPFYQSLVTNGSVTQNELDGTRKHLSSILATLKTTPPEKIEEMVAQYDDKLTEHLNSFNGKGQTDLVSGLRDAQIMAGFVTTVMAKSGLRG